MTLDLIVQRALDIALHGSNDPKECLAVSRALRAAADNAEDLDHASYRLFRAGGAMRYRQRLMGDECRRRLKMRP